MKKLEDRILKLYSQFIPTTDRRQQQQPVEVERRNRDRRQRTGDSRILADLDKFKSFTNNSDLRKDVITVLSPLAPVRRISSLPDNVDDGNYSRASGLLALAIVNLPEDTRDLKAAWNQITKGELPKYDYKEYQHPFSFLRGTLFEPFLGKMGNLGAWLCQQDVPIYSTKIGEYLEKIFKFKIVDSVFTGREVPWVIKDEGGKPCLKKVDIMALRLDGSPLAKIIGKSLLRMPKISAVCLLLLELPAIIKEILKPKSLKSKAINGTRQSVKSIINVSSILSGIGIGGALLSKRGPAGSLVGMGIGSVIGVYTSKRISKFLDNLISNKKTT